jgi:hypothetical protein
MNRNSIIFLGLRLHRLHSKIGIVVNFVAAHLRQDHLITDAFHKPQRVDIGALLGNLRRVSGSYYHLVRMAFSMAFISDSIWLSRTAYLRVSLG